jgi:hypothetical protein
MLPKDPSTDNGVETFSFFFWDPLSPPRREERWQWGPVTRNLVGNSSIRVRV